MTTSPELARALANPDALARTRTRTDVLRDAAARGAHYIATAADRPVFPGADAVAALESFRRPLQDDPVAPAEVLAELDRLGSPATVVATHGRYFGFVNGGTDPASHAAAVLASAWDQNVGGMVMSPAAATVDQVACGWVIDALGLPEGAAASFNGGATVANLTGVIAGRDALYARAGWSVAERGVASAPPLRVVVGEEVHLSALKALRLAGFGADQIERVPTDSNGAVIADAFPTDTDHLTLVLLQAGNVNTGASDPFEAIIPGVRERGGWVHIDGAFGLWAAASPTYRDQVRGVENADSWATDAHKWLNVPYDSGIIVIREAEDAVRAMSGAAAYLADTNEGSMHRGIQMSQRARGVETWAMLASHGKRGLAELIDRTCSHARRFADALAAGGADILAPVHLNQVLVRFGDDKQTAGVIAAIHDDGTAWAGRTIWKGRAAMRISVSDAATTVDDVDATVEALLRCWAAVRA